MAHALKGCLRVLTFTRLILAVYLYMGIMWTGFAWLQLSYAVGNVGVRFLYYSAPELADEPALLRALCGKRVGDLIHAGISATRAMRRAMR